MKQLYLVILLALISSGVMAQASFSDDFESYTADQFLGPQSPNWTTWSLKDGTAEDTKVTTAKAASGTKSIYFSSTASGGGPQDVVLPFTDAYTTGVFEIGMKFFIEDGKTAYFNIQGEKAIGTTWSIDVNFTADKRLTINGGSELLAFAAYSQNEWISLRIKGNMTDNIWEASLNDIKIGSFKLTSNKVASIDIYPANQNASFYVDDFYYNQSPYVKSDNDLAISGTNILARDITGSTQNLKVDVKNLGNNIINGFDLGYDYGANQSNIKHEGTINPGQTVTVELGNFDILENFNTILINLAPAVDDDLTNNSIGVSVFGLSTPEDKMVVAEEGTGTWCGWCPRGAVILDKLSRKYTENFIGIAVHNNDPMLLAEYNTGMAFGAFPNVKVNRGNAVDPLGLEAEFFTRASETPKGKLRVGADYDPISRVLKVSSKAIFKSNVTGPYKMLVVISEDSVTGTAAGYAQSNYYAGGGSGPMGGYELLPSPVPANKMVYDHVGRALLGGFGGTKLEKNSYKVGDEVLMNFEITLPSNIRVEKIHLIPMLLNPGGIIDNAFTATLQEAIAEGFTVGSKDLSIVKDVKLYPNPFSNQSIFEINLENSEDVIIEIYDNSGKMIGHKNYGELSGKNELVVNAEHLSPGMYFAKILIGKEALSQTFYINKQ